MYYYGEMDPTHHEGYNGEDFEYEEPLFQDASQLQVGDLSYNSGDELVFWDGTDWEPVKTPDGASIKYGNPIAQELVNIGSRFNSYTHDELLAVLVQYERENKEMLEAIHQLQDEIVKYDRLGTPEEIDECLDTTEKMLAEQKKLFNIGGVDNLEDAINHFGTLCDAIKSVFGQENSYENLMNRGWILVATTKKIVDELKETNSEFRVIEIADESTVRLLYKDKD